jgi:hypothetical protein
MHVSHRLLAHSRANSRIAKQQRGGRFGVAAGVCYPPADYLHTWQLGFASFVVLLPSVVGRSLEVSRGRHTPAQTQELQNSNGVGVSVLQTVSATLLQTICTPGN